MKNKSIGFIGGGRITKIILQALKNKNISFNKTVIFDTNLESLSKLNNNFPFINIENENIKNAAECDIVILSIHPPVLIETLGKIKEYLKKESILISLAPKITIEKIKIALDGFDTVARVNPSAPGIINQGINPIAVSKSISEISKKTIIDLFQILGKTMIVDEEKIEAYALISAMGSTYFWFQLNKLKELGVKFGMSEEEAKEVISEMLSGTAKTLFDSELTSDEVMNLVPVKPIGEYENTIKGFYDEKLNDLFEKIKP